jgi:hypothetical protein
MSIRQPGSPLVKAYRWRDWTLGIDGANELTATPQATNFIPFLDASEIVEYVLPSSLLANEFPTRLDLSLSLLFTDYDKLFVFGPHAHEINGVRESWQERMSLVVQELEVVKKNLLEHDASGQLVEQQIEEQLSAISAAGLKDRAQDLVKLLRDNHRWIFSAWRVPYEDLLGFFDRILRQLQVPAAIDLGLAEDWTYTPDRASVDAWLHRLDNTDKGKGEPGPNLVDAYALDHLEQAANAASPSRLPVLFTHSGKILQALRRARKESPDILRVNGVSLVQPPHVALVLRLRKDALDSNTLTVLTEELERQRERCNKISALLDEATENGNISSNLHPLRKELEALDDVSTKWDALQKIRQSLEDDGRRSTRGMLEGLRKLLDETARDDDFKNQLSKELDTLIRAVDRLQGEIAKRPLTREHPKGAVTLDTSSGEVTAFVLLNVLPRAGSRPLVPSAAYPTGAFRFRDPLILPYLEKIATALEEFKSSVAREPAVEREGIARLWRILSDLKELRGRPEYFLLMAVFYLAQEKWLQAYDMAGEGVGLVTGGNKNADDNESSLAHAELLLTRAGSARAFVHASRVEVPSACRAFLEIAVRDCLMCLSIKTDSHTSEVDARCLRELAVILSSSREPVYGVGTEWQSLNLRIDREPLVRYASVAGEADVLTIATGLARRAWELGANDDRLQLFFVNTLLYALTEMDNRTVEPSGVALFEDERQELAVALAQGGTDLDPNFIDTLMWHEHVLSEARRSRGEPWEELAANAIGRSKTLAHADLVPNRYYQRLVRMHTKAVNAPRVEEPS